MTHGRLTWLESHAGNAWRLYVQNLAPDATPRGDPTLVAVDRELRGFRVVVEPGGARALLLYVSESLQALPLRCNP